MGAVYAQLSVKERVQIERWKLAKVPVREMARVLQRSKTTNLCPRGCANVGARRHVSLRLATLART